MPSGSDRSPSITSSPSSGRRIFSALASPFKSKSRAIADFSVELENPHKRYLPGEIVKGSVHLRVLKPVRVQHVTVCLRGFVQVYRNPNSPGDSHKGSGAYFAYGRAKKTGGEYFGNGYASLFEDEEVLCGDGRLAEGAYQFNFELDFPDRDLPSSITFERGTISYLITATLTRPTTMSPTTTTDHEVFFLERIDISSLEPPKPRTITLEPVSRRSRAKSQARKLVDQSERRSRKGDSVKTGSDPPRPSEGSSDPSSQTPGQTSQSDQSNQPNEATPVSPTRSQASLETAADEHDRASQAESRNQTSSGGSDGNTTNVSKSSLSSRVITATIESQSGGCLRGDSIPVKVNIAHTKHIRSMYGVIVTLFRQARVDMHPTIPLGPTEKGQGSKYEDYYPRSVTGLGGLSLSGGGSSHVYRKDLTQTMVPLMIDPNSLTAEVNAKVRVPEGAFPTISTVPGGMISFKYYVEVVLDIQGKLTGQDRALANLSAGGMPGHLLHNDNSDMERSAFTPFGSTIVDTASVRRDKSVVSCSFEVVIGTSDSERKRGKQRVREEAAQEPARERSQQQQEASQQVDVAHDQRDWYNAGPYHEQHWYQDNQYQWAGYNDGYQDVDYGPVQDYDQPPPLMPIPSLPDESQMSEKERVRQAETRLLPSQPPGAEANGEADATAGATAPYIQEETTNGTHGPEAWPSVPAYEPVASGSGSNSNLQPSTSVSPDRPVSAGQFPSVPEYEPPAAGSSAAASAGATDDKQEMQRQQLQAQASAPPGEDNDEEEEATRAAGPEAAPSAPPPVLVGANGEVHDSHADAPGSHDLPQYER